MNLIKCEILETPFLPIPITLFFFPDYLFYYLQKVLDE